MGEDLPVDSHGFLIDTSSWYRQPPSVVPLIDACSASAVLLGEAGIGKSSALDTVLEATQMSRGWDAQVRVDLGQVRSWEDLTRKADSVLSRLGPTGHAPAASSSDAEAGHRHLLVVDGVDECRATGKEIAGWFTDLAATYDCRWLQVLIACRSMAYTDVLSQAVIAAFGIDEARTYTLAPLRRSDLVAAASTKGVDPKLFLEAVTEAGAQALARTPLTLDLLLDTFLEHSTLPASRASLYSFALPHAVMHQGDDRAPDDLAGSQSQRFATAARLACYCVLTGAEGITTRRRTEPGQALLAIDTFLGTREGTPGDTFTIERPIVEGVLNSSLFSNRGPAAAGPAHASIASYLTAQYLTDHQVPREQLQGLLVHRGEVGEPGIPTDLHELAAWLISLCPDLGPWLIEVDPQAIASYSSYIEDPHCAELIVDGLLRQARQDTTGDGLPWWRMTPLRHPGLTRQLEQALHEAVNRAPHITHELELILNLIAENEVGELLQAVASIACDAQHPHRLRRLAAQCAGMLDQTEAAPLLRPILAELAQQPEHDPADGLRGAVLQTCQPWLTLDELLAALTPPRTDPSLYTSFCRRLPASLSEDQIAPFLGWAGSHLMNPNSLWAGWSDEAAMVQGLLDRALSGPEAEARVPIVAVWLRIYLQTYPQLSVPAPLCAPLDDPDNQHARHLRRTLTRHLIDVAQDAEDAFQLAEGWDPHSTRTVRSRFETSVGPEREQRTSLLDATDLAWLVKFEQSLSDQKAPHAWPMLQHVWSMARTTDAGQDTAWSTQGTRVWSQVFAQDLEAIPIDGPRADQLRAQAARRQSRTEPWQGRDEYITTTREFLAQAESGDHDSFVSLCWNLQCDPDTGRFAATELLTDLLSLPGTVILADGYEHRLLAVARRFVTNGLPTDSSWIRTNSLPARPWAAIFAFTALLNDDGEILATLPSGQWQAWAPTLLAFPLTSTAARHVGPRGQLLEMALLHAALQLETTYDTLVRALYEAEETSPVLDLASYIWTPELETRLLQTLTDLTAQAHEKAPAIGPGGHDVLARVLTILLRQGSPRVCHQVRDRFGAPLSEPNPASDERLDAAYLRVFLLETPTEIWPTAEHRLRTDGTALVAVSGAFSRSHSTQAWLFKLSEPALAEIARILLGRFPSTDSAGSSPPGATAAQTHIDVVLDHLASRGTGEAIRLLRELAADWPKTSIIRAAAQKAVQAHREGSWVRPSPDELSQLIHDPRRRLVRNGTDLMDVVIALLNKMQEDLTQGTLPAAILWNETELETLPNGQSGKQRLRFPKDENLVSDYLAYALRRDLVEGGILINREVQVYRNIKGAGDRIDLLLQAPTAAATHSSPQRQEESVAQVAIEVKGNWHDKIKTAMQTQLADDYLAALGTRNGIYLIAFFPTDQWTAKERKRPAARQTPAGLKETYDAQAAQLNESRNLNVRAFVLDCTIRSSAQRNT
ncbi:NACHT domain-containing protein [Streptomyces europaeiscabiei]|uniref:NACHT domain-containing protein n=1 Tax=Streptomyces europaeiscabiei TaxID=146819 RepID=UPI0029C00AFA|nr:NACHT domain-containing protein [Streptomyces europaeiscabiei]